MLKLSDISSDNFNISSLYEINAEKLFPDFHNWVPELNERGVVSREKVVFYFPTGKDELRFSSVSIASKMLARLAFREPTDALKTMDWTTYMVDIKV